MAEREGLAAPPFDPSAPRPLSERRPRLRRFTPVEVALVVTVVAFSGWSAAFALSDYERLLGMSGLQGSTSVPPGNWTSLLDRQIVPSTGSGAFSFHLKGWQNELLALFYFNASGHTQTISLNVSNSPNSCGTQIAEGGDIYEGPPPPGETSYENSATLGLGGCGNLANRAWYLGYVVSADNAHVRLFADEGANTSVNATVVHQGSPTPLGWWPHSKVPPTFAGTNRDLPGVPSDTELWLPRFLGVPW